MSIQILSRLDCRVSQTNLVTRYNQSLPKKKFLLLAMPECSNMSDSFSGHILQVQSQPVQLWKGLLEFAGNLVGLAFFSHLLLLA